MALNWQASLMIPRKGFPTQLQHCWQACPIQKSLFLSVAAVLRHFGGKASLILVGTRAPYSLGTATGSNVYF